MESQTFITFNKKECNERIGVKNGRGGSNIDGLDGLNRNGLDGSNRNELDR